MHRHKWFYAEKIEAKVAISYLHSTDKVKRIQHTECSNSIYIPTLHAYTKIAITTGFLKMLTGTYIHRSWVKLKVNCHKWSLTNWP